MRAAATESALAFIRGTLPRGLCQVENLALVWGCDRRTVHRRLALEGASFTLLVEEERRQLAAAAIASDAPMGEIAPQLGFTSLSTFSRWYRHSFGRTPTAGRRGD